VSLFDAVFGSDHLSLRCFLRSTVASLIAVALIWALMGNLGTLGTRLQAELSLGSLLVLALAVNVVADYVSLLETRLLLGWMPRIRSTLAQAGVLLLDLILSAAIIWLAIFAFLRSPLHEGEVETFAEILGVFSTFSVLFYSTFLTSVWTWTYILSTWLVRAFARLRLAHWLDVENKPLLILGHALAVVVFFGALAAAAAMRRDEDGLTAADRALCSLFQGRVCLDVAGLTVEEEARFNLVLLACGGEMSNACLQRGFATQAAQLWHLGCADGHLPACTNLGILYGGGIGVDADLAEAARLLRQSCDGGYARGCSHLGHLHEATDPQPAEAARLYRQGCDGGDAFGCIRLAFLHVSGIGMDPDPVEVVRAYRRACDLGNAWGCTQLGVQHQQGLRMDPDRAEAARLYRQGCEGGDAAGCAYLAMSLEAGWIEADPAEAAEFWQAACALGWEMAPCDRRAEGRPR
jgi:TPR repeat protein